MGIGLFLLVGACLSLAALHPANIASARLKVGADGAVDLKLRFDVLAYVLEEQPDQTTSAEMASLVDGPPEQLADRLRDAESRLLAELKLFVGGSAVELGSNSFPTADDVLRAASMNGATRFPIMLSVPLRAQLPKGAESLLVRFPEVLGTVVLTTELPYQEPVSEPVEAGSASSEVRIPHQAEVSRLASAMFAERPPAADVAKSPSIVPQRGAIAAAAAEPAARAQEKPLIRIKPPSAKAAVGAVPEKGPLPVVAPTLKAPAPAVSVLPGEPRPAWWVMLARYVKMGFHHIIPLGLDHVLFVLGLFLLSTKTRDLLKQVSAFTVAHSITLGLSLYGVIQLPRGVVEPLIALSIAFVAIENVLTTKMQSWRPLVVFGFGLVHGLGFAGALRETGLARGDFLTGLVGFNLGVECGQLAVVFAALATVGWLRSSPRYRPAVVVPASLAIAAVALFWVVQRTFWT